MRFTATTGSAHYFFFFRRAAKSEPSSLPSLSTSSFFCFGDIFFAADFLAVFLSWFISSSPYMLYRYRRYTSSLSSLTLGPCQNLARPFSYHIHMLRTLFFTFRMGFIFMPFPGCLFAFFDGLGPSLLG